MILIVVSGYWLGNELKMENCVVKGVTAGKKRVVGVYMNVQRMKNK